MSPRTREKEQDIQKAIMELLEWNGFLVVKINNVGIRKENGHFIPPRRKGVSDILACSPTGRFWAIEVKKSGGVATTEQKMFLQEARDRNGIGFIAYSVQDVEEYLHRYKLLPKQTHI